MIEINKIYNCDCLDGLKQMDANSVNLTVTSPPYDNLRKYTDKESGDCEWNFEIFKPIADELFRVTKNGGVVVWVVGDACVNGSETGSSFKQALYFQKIGFNLHDTMIYEKNSSSFPAKLTSKRYTQIFEYMFIFSKGKIRNDIKLIADKKNKWAGWTNWGTHSQYGKSGELQKTNNIKPIAEFSLRNNIWRYPVSFNDKTNHPAVFPEKLAEDHILSWSLEGDLVLDPFMGSGTTAKMAMINNRNYIGFERNSEYFEESLKRINNHIGKENIYRYEIDSHNMNNLDDDTQNISLQVNPTADKDDDKKYQLWKELTKELEDYFNTQSYGILKNLKVNLSFSSKSNDDRIKKLFNDSPDDKQNNLLIKDNFEEQTGNLFDDYDNNASSSPSLIENNVTPQIEPINESFIRNVIRQLLDEEFEQYLSKYYVSKVSTANNSYFDVIPKVDNPVLINVDDTTTILKSGRGKDKKPRKRRTKRY